jgi:hypothetical protein
MEPFSELKEVTAAGKNSPTEDPRSVALATLAIDELPLGVAAT